MMQVAPYPYLVRARSTCLGISAPVLINQEAFLVTPFDEDFCIGVMEQLDSRFVQRFDPLMVTLRFGSTEDRFFETPLVQGSPYITLVFNNTIPLLASKEDVITPKGSLSGNRLMFQLQNGRQWLIYASKPLQLTVGTTNGTEAFNTSGPSRKTVLTGTAPYTGELLACRLGGT
jgi:hypothetical protein